MMEKIGYSLLKGLCSTSQETVNYSFNVIFNKYRYLVYYVSFDIVKNKEDAEDIVNETFLKMYEKRGTFAKESELKYFLLTVSKNLSFNKYNERNDHQSYSDEMGGTTDGSNISLYLDKFREILDETEYQYLVLHLVYDFSYKEIANANTLTTSQVSSKYQRGIKKLRDFYGGSINE